MVIIPSVTIIFQCRKMWTDNRSFGKESSFWWAKLCHNIPTIVLYRKVPIIKDMPVHVALCKFLPYWIVGGAHVENNLPRYDPEATILAWSRIGIHGIIETYKEMIYQSSTSILNYLQGKPICPRTFRYAFQCMK